MLDPTRVRLSPHFLLSDFMGCHSVYAKGYRNIFEDNAGKLLQGRMLANHLLEPLLSEFGPASISYGYISPELSQKIVSYQDPNKPSYHRWDLGAAADLCFHNWVQAEDTDTVDTSPAKLAHAIDESYTYSRMITYSESPYICLATNAGEIAINEARKAFYENRFTGQRRVKPVFITKPKSAAGRTKAAAQLAEEGLPHGWRGEGYPTYHGGGIRQLHHVRASRHSMVSDYLFNLKSITNGVPNLPTLKPEVRKAFFAAGRLYDHLLVAFDVPRFSIIRGFEAIRWSKCEKAAWNAGQFAMTVVPPEYIPVDDVLAYVESLPGILSAEVVDGHAVAIERSF